MTKRAQDSKTPLTLILKGGLGNQFFQIGAAIESSKLSGQSVHIACPSGLRDKRQRPHALTLYPELQRIDRLSETLISPLVFRRVATAPIFRNLVLSDANAEIIGTTARPWKWISGYFQNYRFTDDVARRLKERLLNEKNIIHVPHIAVHVRRSDFLNFPHLREEYQFLMKHYYAPAIAKAHEAMGADADLLLVSDDPEGAEADLKKALSQKIRIKRANGNSIWQDLTFLARADALVSSNSTFCWWAARVSSGLIFMPQQWLDREHARPEATFNFNLPNAIAI